MTVGKRVLKAPPALVILCSFLSLIGTGTVLLMLPFSTHQGQIPFIDALFTATSAVCVTGLTVVDTGTVYTGCGQGIILALIQIGGLGLMTISAALFQWMGRSISIRQRMAVQDMFTHTPREDILSLVKSVLFFTLGTEAAGVILLTIHWSGESSFPSVLYVSLFHSVSAFCNAGFSLFPDNLMRYRGSILLNVTVCGLIVVGGIGFPVLYDLHSWIRRSGRERVRLSLQTKTVLLTTLLLIVSGALLIAVLERQSMTMGGSWPERILASLFQSITCRTAGFNTVDIPSLRSATLFLMIFLMFVGASPGSCGGGIKTTTLALIAAFALGRLRRELRVNLWKKSIPVETVTRSLSLVLIAAGIITIILFLVLAGDVGSGRGIPERHGAFLTYLFEIVSAFGTVGLSMGVTPELGVWGKGWIIVMMLVGRVGVLTFSYIFVSMGAIHQREYSEENMMIG